MVNQMTDKAKRERVRIGVLSVEGFQMPDGSYRMSLNSMAEAVGLVRRNAFDFLRSKAAKRLLGEGFTSSISEIEVEPSENQSSGQTRIQALPLRVVSKYWLWQAYRGNKIAFALVDALLEESLERRFDNAFGIERTESERNVRLSERLRSVEQERDLAVDAIALPDIYQEHIARLEQQIRRLGEEPWQLPDEEDSDP